MDGDQYGNPYNSQDVHSDSCPRGWVRDNTDCVDTDSAVNPNALEICDGIDNDCNSLVDEGCDIESWMLEITAIGQGGDKSFVYIGIDSNGAAYPYPPGNPPGFSAVVKVKGPDTGYSEDYRVPGDGQEVWELEVMVGGSIFGGDADADLPGFFPVLSWYPNEIGPAQVMDLRLGDAYGPVILDMRTANTYQILGIGCKGIYSFGRL